VTQPGDARALATFLRSRAEIEGTGFFVPAGESAGLIGQLHELAIAGRPELSFRKSVGEGVVEDVESITDLSSVRQVAESCIRCTLHSTRRTVVFSDGPDRARVMCVGEAPGAREDETGVPFVGRAGQLLDRLLLSVGLAREEVYICNVLKCRPPGNRNPQPDEIEQCSPFLRRQVALVKPEVVIAFGAFAAQTLLGVRASLGSMRGQIHAYEGVPLIATYHPAALLRNPHWTRPSWEDLQQARLLLEEGGNG